MAIDIAIPAIFTVPSIGSSNAAQAEPTYHNTPAERRVTVSASLRPSSLPLDLQSLSLRATSLFCPCCAALSSVLAVCAPRFRLSSRACAPPKKPHL